MSHGDTYYAMHHEHFKAKSIEKMKAHDNPADRAAAFLDNFLEDFTSLFGQLSAPGVSFETAKAEVAAALSHMHAESDHIKNFIKHGK